MMFAAALYASAQEESSVAPASLVVVNAVPGQDNVHVSFDGQSIWPPGFTPGQSTAAVMFPSGSKALKIECEGYAATEAKLELPSGANCAIIMYLGELVVDGPDKGKRRIGVFVPSPHMRGAPPARGMRWKAVLVGSAEPREVEINGRRVLLAPRKTTEIPDVDGAVVLKDRGADIFGSAPEDAGEYWVVLYPSGDELKAVLLNHSPFPVPSE